MAMTTCSECKAAISDTASICPQCGYHKPEPKKFKWWLWGPLSVVAIFLWFGLTTKDYEIVASKRRDFCMEAAKAGVRTKDQCDAAYREEIALGKSMNSR